MAESSRTLILTILTHRSPIGAHLVRFDSAASSIKLPINGRLFPVFKDIMYGNGNATVADFVLGSDFTGLETFHFCLALKHLQMEAYLKNCLEALPVVSKTSLLTKAM
jgi:hypothetical protein